MPCSACIVRAADKPCDSPLGAHVHTRAYYYAVLTDALVFDRKDTNDSRQNDFKLQLSFFAEIIQGHGGLIVDSTTPCPEKNEPIVF